MKLRDIKGIGHKTELELNKNNIYTLNDLLYLFPKSYNIYELRPDLLFEGQYTTIEAIITNTPYFIKYRKNVNAIVFTALINNQKVKCIYFSSDYLRYKLFKNTKVMLYGKYKSEASEFHVKKMFFNDFISKVDCDYKIDNITNAILRKAVKALFDNNISKFI